jgi:hypothetical protein
MTRAALVVLALVLWGGWLLTPVSSGAGPLVQLDEEQVREAVLRANSDAIYGEAYRTSNPELLREAWAGEALLDMQDDIQALRALGQYLDLQLEDIQFQRIQELGPGRIRAVTVEHWLARLYQTNGTYLGYQRQIVENRYLLDRRDTNWYIIEADQEIQGGDPVFRQGEP